MLKTPERFFPEQAPIYATGLKEVLLYLKLGNAQYSQFLKSQDIYREDESILAAIMGLAGGIRRGLGSLVYDRPLEDTDPTVPLIEFIYHGFRETIDQSLLSAVESKILSLGQLLLDSLGLAKINDSEKEEIPQEKPPEKEPDLRIKLDFNKRLIVLPDRYKTRNIQIECADFDEMETTLRSMYVGYEYSTTLHIAALNNAQESRSEDGFFQPAI